MTQKYRRTIGALAAFGAALFFTSACVAPGSARAQQVDPSTLKSYTDLSAFLVDNPSATRAPATTATSTGSSTVTQIGQANSATVTLGAGTNITNQFQNGSQNSSNLSINGEQNSVSTTQVGNSNTTSIGVNGNGNTINNLQVGSGLSYQIQVTGTSPAPISVQQYGRR